jgi:hypothetical protein
MRDGPISKYDGGKKGLDDDVQPQRKYNLAVRAVAKMTGNSPDVVAAKPYKVAAIGAAKLAVSVGAKVLDAHTGGAASLTVAAVKGIMAVKRIAQGREKSVPRELAGAAPNPATDRVVGKVAELAMGF